MNRNITKTFEQRYPWLVDFEKQGLYKDFIALKRELVAKYPQWDDPEPVECLNLIMRREFAQQIVDGIKKVEFRAPSDFYIRKLVDKDCDEFQGRLDGDDVRFYPVTEPVRPVKKIHFHNYNNTWSLDVEVTDTRYIICNKDGIDWLHSYGCYDLDDMMREERKTPTIHKPAFFCFAVGRILDRANI